MGCLARLGCLLLLALLAAAGWFTRRFWLPLLDRYRGEHVEAVAVPTWQPLSEAGAARADSAMRRLELGGRGRGGAMYVTVTAGDLLSYVARELTQQLPESADSIEAAAIDDRVRVRALVRTADLGDRRDLGPLALLLGERERVEMAGVLRIIRPGLGELRITEFRVRDIALPDALIPRIVQQITRRRPVDSAVSPGGIPLRTPEYVADVRVQNGRITLYRPTAP